MKGLRGLLGIMQPAALFALPVILGAMLEFGLGQLTSPYNAQGGQIPLKSVLHFVAVGIAFAFQRVVYLGIRTRVSEIRELGRATQGVTLINLGENEKLSGLEKIVEADHDIEE